MLKSNEQDLEIAADIARKKVWQDPFFFVAFGFGSGLAPFAPGTWGTLIAFILYWIFVSSPLWIYSLVIVVGFIAGIFICERVTQALKINDYKGIVWDEIIGYWLTMWAIPRSVTFALLGFLLFRIIDIYKPYPIYRIEQRINGGLGVMLDDILAAIPACLMLHGLVWVVNHTDIVLP